ncbi:MAG: hypothetical protein SWH68_06405, partial [Thermodesulfobacteriota bacterium]|nr:hypothetical protein [Thermodesulfobacteriota bacterium]
KVRPYTVRDMTRDTSQRRYWAFYEAVKGKKRKTVHRENEALACSFSVNRLVRLIAHALSLTLSEKFDIP